MKSPLLSQSEEEDPSLMVENGLLGSIPHLFKLENLINFGDYSALKVKIINVTLTPSTKIGENISVAGIPQSSVYVTGFLYNYIKVEANNIYEHWDLQVSLPATCIIKKKKEYNITGYATVLAFYK